MMTVCVAQEKPKPAVPPKVPAKIPGWPTKTPVKMPAPAPKEVKTPQGKILERPKGAGIGARAKYVDGKSYRYRDHDFNRRVYYVHGKVYERYYRGYRYHGVVLSAYAPVRYYPAAYYGWAYHPWIAPVPYIWVWAGNPWAVYYGPYFAPYAVYPSAGLWLADYVVASSLQARYQAMADAANGGALPPLAQTIAPMTPEVRQAISGEVQGQVALESYEAQQVAQGNDPEPASSGIARMLQDNAAHTFVVGGDLSVVTSSGQACELGKGDVVQVSGPVAMDSSVVNAAVLASQAQDCLKGSAVVVQLSDLQEMQNYLRETVDQGLGQLRTEAGQGSLPALPAPAQGAPTTPPFAAIAPPADPSVAGADAPQQQAAQEVPPQIPQPAVVGKTTSVLDAATTRLDQVKQAAANLGVSSGGGQPASSPPASETSVGGARRDAADGAWSGDLTCSGEPVAQNAEFVFRNLPAGKLQLTYNSRIWEARLTPGDGQTQQLILRNKGAGPQKKCVVHWILEN